MDPIVIKTDLDFSNLFYSISTNKIHSDIDISGLKFLEPKDVLMISEYFLIQNKNGIDGSIICSDDNSRYIDAIWLVDFCNTNHSCPISQPQRIKSAIPIKRIDVSTLDHYILHAKQFFSGYCIGKDTSVLAICIAEIINNVYDHSRSEFGAYIFSQFYKQKNLIRFAISDLGVGIPMTVNDFHLRQGLPKLRNIEALIWATTIGKTAKSTPKNRGFGLDNVISFLRSSCSNIEIFTDGVYCKLSDKGSLFFKANPISYFIGTLITITLKIDKLLPVDETILEDFTF